MWRSTSSSSSGSVFIQISWSRVIKLEEVARENDVNVGVVVVVLAGQYVACHAAIDANVLDFDPALYEHPTELAYKVFQLDVERGIVQARVNGHRLIEQIVQSLHLLIGEHAVVFVSYCCIHIVSIRVF